MKANKLFIYVAMSLATLSLSSCHDWLTDGTPGVSHPEDYLTSGKALVELDGAPFKYFAAHRDEWAKNTCYVYPGPIQYFGPTEVCDQSTKTLQLEQA